jgi:amino acid permease
MLNRAAPFAYAFSQHNVMWATAVVSAGAIAGITSVLLISLLAQPRIFFSLSRDGLLPARISKVHPRFRTPYISTIITGVAVAICAGILPIGVAAELTNIGTLFAFFLVSIGIIILRRSRPDLHRPFKVPLVPVIPIIGAGFCLLLMVSLPAITWYRFIAWLGIGLIIYANYGYHHSKAMKRARETGDEEAVGSGQSAVGYDDEASGRSDDRAIGRQSAEGERDERTVPESRPAGRPESRTEPKQKGGWGRSPRGGKQAATSSDDGLPDAGEPVVDVVETEAD